MLAQLIGELRGDFVALSSLVIAGLDPAIHSLTPQFMEKSRHGCPDQVRA
jgi:hypothetical protein